MKIGTCTKVKRCILVKGVSLIRIIVCFGIMRETIRTRMRIGSTPSKKLFNLIIHSLDDVRQFPTLRFFLFQKVASNFLSGLAYPIVREET